MAEYTYRFEPSIDLITEAQRVHGLLDALLPEPKRNTTSGRRAGGQWSSRIGEREGIVQSFYTENPLDYHGISLKVETDTRKPGEAVITSQILTEAQIQRMLETKR